MRTGRPLMRALKLGVAVAIAIQVVGCTSSSNQDVQPDGSDRTNLGDGQTVAISAEQGAGTTEEAANGQQAKPGVAATNASQTGKPANQQVGQQGSLPGGQVINPGNPQGSGGPPQGLPPSSQAGGQLPVLPGEGFFDPNPNPPQDGRFDQGNQCKYAGFSAGGGFGLAEATGYIPPSVVVRMSLVERYKDGKEMQKSRNCIGIIGVRHYEGTLQADAGQTFAKEENAQADFYYPRISLARHCAISTVSPDEFAKGLESRTLTKMQFISVSNSQEAIEYSVNNDLLSMNDREQWYIDFEGRSHSRSTINDLEDPCTDTAKQQKLDTPCFTVKTDRINILMREELDLLSKGKERVDGYPLSSFQAHSGFLVNTLAKTEKFSWPKLFGDKKIKVVEDLELTSCDLKIQGIASYRSKEDVIQCWNKTLRRIQATKLVYEPGKADITQPLELKPNQSWDTIIDVYGTQSGDRFIIEAVGLRSNPGFQEGHSGTILVGEFIEADLSSDIVLRSSKRILGSLSTVAGKPVCTGDDLQCCDKI